MTMFNKKFAKFLKFYKPILIITQYKLALAPLLPTTYLELNNFGQECTI